MSGKKNGWWVKSMCKTRSKSAVKGCFKQNYIHNADKKQLDTIKNKYLENTIYL